MILARVVGTVVATRKDPRLEGKKLLILKPIAPDGKDESGYVVSGLYVDAGPVMGGAPTGAGADSRLGGACRGWDCVPTMPVVGAAARASRPAGERSSPRASAPASSSARHATIRRALLRLFGVFI